MENEMIREVQIKQPEGYRITWISETGTRGRGTGMMPKYLADAEVRRLNAKYPTIRHLAQWVNIEILEMEKGKHEGW